MRYVIRYIPGKIAADCDDCCATRGSIMSKSFTPKVGAKKTPTTHRKSTSEVSAKNPASAKGRIDHQIEEFHTQVPASMRALAEMNVAQTRALYQRSANAFEAVFERWEDCLDAVGQGAVAFNRKIMDIAERNISTGFDLATRLARAKNPVEAIELQAAYWRKQFGELRMQAGEVRTLLERVTDRAAEPIKAQVTLDRMPR